MHIARSRRFTEGLAAARLILFSLPMIAGNMLQQVYSLVDTYIVGKYLGAGALVVSADKDVNLRGIVIVGSLDGNAAGERVGALMEGLHVDGAFFACNGEGSNHVDHAKSIEETEKRGIPVCALSYDEATYCFWRKK